MLLINCPSCSYENSGEARTCKNCGEELVQTCSACGTDNVVQAKFCMQCGSRLLSADHGSKLSTGIIPKPDGATQFPNNKTASGSLSSLVGERRTVSVLFADVVGSTALSEKMDPEDWTMVMNQAFDRIIPVIFRYEGTVARLAGDSVLAFFGAPTAHEDDPARAINAGLDIISSIYQYAVDLKYTYDIDFAVRVGVTTGPVVVGEVGSRLAYEYTAMGDSVNLASRIQAAARPMEVWTSENTYRYIAPLFDCVDLGVITLKGKSEPVRVFQVIGKKDQPGRLRGLTGRNSLMVGRQVELDKLLQVSQVVRAGLGRAVLILGEAGLGKSRLVSEWRKIAPKGLRWVEGSCLSYGQGLPFHLLVDLIENGLGLTKNANPQESKAILETFIHSLFSDGTDELILYFSHLLSMPLSPTEREQINLVDPQMLQRMVYQVVRKVLTSFAYQAPAVLVMDDLHWSDPSSVDLIISLLPLVHEAPVLFCLVSRPQAGTPGWTLVNAVRENLQDVLTEIELHALSEQESNELIGYLLDQQASSGEIYNLVQKKGEGNPLFVEEILRKLVDQAYIVHSDEGWLLNKDVSDVIIPGSLQGMLQAHIDSLPEDERHVLRVASVIGRQFSVRLLEEVLTSEKKNGIKA